MKYLLLITILAASLLRCAAQEASLTPTSCQLFTLQDGATVEGSLTGFEGWKELVVLTTPDGNKKRIELSSFSPEDQDHIRAWHEAYSLISQGMIRLRLKKNEEKGLRYHGALSGWPLFPSPDEGSRWLSHYPGIDYTKLEYSFEIENRTETTLKDIRVEYCIYHESNIEGTLGQSRFVIRGNMRIWEGISSRRDEAKTVMHEMKDIIRFDEVPSSKKVTACTYQLKLINGSTIGLDNRYAGAKEGDVIDSQTWKVDEKPVGIRYRMYIPIASGGYAMKEFADPPKLLRTTTWPADNPEPGSVR